MKEQLKEIYRLHKEGKLNKKLLFSLGLLTFFTLGSFSILVFDIVSQGLSVWKSFAFATLGFFLTFFFFIKMTKLVWDKESSTISLGKFDFSSFAILAIFIAYRIGINEFLEGYYENTFEIAGLSLATIFGGLLGRLSGTLIAILHTHTERN